MSASQKATQEKRQNEVIRALHPFFTKLRGQYEETETVPTYDEETFILAEDLAQAPFCNGLPPKPQEGEGNSSEVESFSWTIWKLKCMGFFEGERKVGVPRDLVEKLRQLGVLE